MPHGISFDSDDNAWLTDVALHQILRFKKTDLNEPDLILGERFVPGSDEKHFCKPTDVQVSSKTDLVFISDGYCNSRVMVFNKDGKFLKQFGHDQEMIVPHSMSLIEELDLICVADRQRSRIICFNAGIKNRNKLGELIRILEPPKGFNSHPGSSDSVPVYAIQNIGNSKY